MIKIHVKPKVIAGNRDNGQVNPPIAIIHDPNEDPEMVSHVDILDENKKIVAQVVYDPSAKSTAKVWIQTENQIITR